MSHIPYTETVFARQSSDLSAYSIWCSDIIQIVTECRCFVRYKSLLDVRYYKGNWDSQLDLKIVK
jgi:hypothetical protein